MGKHRLLVIDDDDLIAELVVEAGRQVGYEARAVYNFESFKEALVEDAPALIVLDLVLPHVDGIEILRYLSEARCTSQILLLSGLDSKVLQTAERLGSSLGLNIVGLLTKPVSMSAVRSELSRHFKGQAGATPEDLASAIENGDLDIHLQRKVRLVNAGGDTGLGITRGGFYYPVYGFEALARWQRGGDYIPPDKFIAMAESENLIRPLTELITGKVIDALAELNRHKIHTSISLNLSAYLLDDLELPDKLANMAAEQQVQPSQIVLEITESAVMTENTAVLDIITRFRVKGFGLSLDDFGTGFSSLLRLYRMPFNELKIDRSFVSESDSREEAATIVKSIVTLGHNLGLTVCAEGVETAGEAAYLRSLGCDHAQGYFFGKPTSSDLAVKGCQPVETAAASS